MLVLEATSDEQGTRPDDYHWCVDGELAYKPALECSCPDCGCNRGWAGLESRQATTTVRVVDRPDLTVETLALKLAEFLNDAGCITTPAPGDELVSMLVDEILETATHFGEGAVLEREGEWTRLRDGTTNPINPFDRVTLEQITEGLLEEPPLGVLRRAMANMHSAGPLVEAMITTLAEADWPEAQRLGCALEWLWKGPPALPWHSLPEWLAHLDEAEVTAARRSRGNDGDGYLVAISVRDVELGIASYYLKHDGKIDSFFAIPDTIDNYVQLMKTLQRQHYKPFRKVAISTAHNAILNGQAPTTAGADEQWTGASGLADLPLLDFVVKRVRW